MALLEKLTKRAQKIYPRILLPESTDQRVIQAALSLSTQKIAKIILLGNKDEICSQLNQSSENKKHDLEFIDPKDEKLKNDYAKTLFERRKHKGLELNESLDLVNNPTVFAMLALQRGEVDGVVTGAITPSQQVLGNALRIIGVSNNTKLVSSFFLMMFEKNHHNYGQNMIFSDCAMNIDPTAEELAEIAQSAFKSAKSLDIMPKIAMLSFSTNRSTQYSQVEKVRLATSICETKLPDVDIVGNIQLDAALESKVLQIKYPETTFEPPANVLIFPNLDAANIGYKLVQRFSGAKAIVVYNSEPGIFFGELIHEFVDEGYNPTIPALSMSREDGLVIKQMLQSHTEGTLDVFYHPDFVAFFSSRGPVSPFYMKPDIVAPGAFINTTNSGGNYKIVSGTSFAAPHVAGTAALVLQKNPQLTPNELKSILMTTSDVISNEYDERFPVEVAGTGRINAAKAIASELIIIPPNLIFNLSAYNQIQTKDLEIMGIDNQPVSIRFENNQVADFDYDLMRENLTITAKLSQQDLGEYESRMIISYNDVEYNIPIVVRVTKATVLVNEDDGVLSFDVSGHPSWSYAKISVTNKETGETFTESITPTKKSELTVYQPGEYWIEANIKEIDGLSSKTLDVYETIKIEKAEKNQSFVNTLNLPEKPLLIITAVMIITVVAGIFIRKY